jgi:hypothetical protein
MSTPQAQPISPQAYARTGGILYLVIIAAGIFGEIFVRGKLVVNGNAAATAVNIAAHETLWRTGIATDLLMHICDIPLMLIIYVLLRPVNKNIALLALLFNIVQTAVLAANKLNLLSALFATSNAPYLKAIDPAQLQAMAYMSIKLHGYGFSVGLIFFGCACLAYGYLICRSGYFPKILGVLLQIAGAAYLLNSFSLIIAPPVNDALVPYILLPPFIAELSLCLWLLFKGVSPVKD